MAESRSRGRAQAEAAILAYDNHSERERRRAPVFSFLAGAFLLFLAVAGCGGDKPHGTGAAPLTSGPETHRVTFVQWSDPHLFDAGWRRHGEGVLEEALDNRAALHWAVLETNRLVLSEHRTIDFVVITGDFGLENVQLSPTAGGAPPPKHCECPKREIGDEGPIEPVPLSEAAAEVAREFSAVLVKRIYLVPGNNDLCREDPRDLHRWAEFVLALQGEMRKQHATREASLKASGPGGGTRVEAPTMPEVMDLTYSAERLYAAGDPRVRALFPAGTKPPPPVPPEPPEVNGIRLLGLDTAFFKPHKDAAVQKAADQASPAEIDFVRQRIVTGGSYLIFTHIPDVEDPYRGSGGSGRREASSADKASSWKLPGPSTMLEKAKHKASRMLLRNSAPKATRDLWHDDILARSEVIGVFAGHFHSNRRDIYPHNFDYAQNKPDEVTAAKMWLAPSLAAKYQWTLPPEKTARGMLLVTVIGNGAVRVSSEDGKEVKPTPVWFSTLDQKAAAEGDDKLAQARAEERDGHWDEAAKWYAQTLTSGDSRVRATATLGYENARGVMHSWWWQTGKYFPPLRWAFIHPLRTALALPALLLLLAMFKLLRQLGVFAFLGLLIKVFLAPRFRGRAIMNTPVAITKGAPAEEFGAQIQAASEEIRQRLLREQENWAARQISLLSPSASSLDQMVGSVPDVQGVKVSDWLKFLVKLAQTFRWTVESGLAVFAGPNPPPTAPPGGPAPLPVGGQLSAYAVLQWCWFIKNSWKRTVPIKDNSALADLARTMAELLLGEAFARRRLP